MHATAKWSSDCSIEIKPKLNIRPETGTTTDKFVQLYKESEIKLDIEPDKTSKIQLRLKPYSKIQLIPKTKKFRPCGKSACFQMKHWLKNLS